LRNAIEDFTPDGQPIAGEARRLAAARARLVAEEANDQASRDFADFDAASEI
jgi:hypothetical protein